MATQEVGEKLRFLSDDLRNQIEELKDRRESLLYYWERRDFGKLHELGFLTTRDLAQVREALADDRPLGGVRSQETRYARPKSRARSRR